jgi:hypothetical protein
MGEGENGRGGEWEREGEWEKGRGFDIMSDRTTTIKLVCSQGFSSYGRRTKALTANSQQPTVNCQLSTVNYQLSTINYQLSTVLIFTVTIAIATN